MATSTDLSAAVEELRERLPEGHPAIEDLRKFGLGDLTDELERRMGSLPWWVVSSIIHSVIFLVVSLVAVAVAPAVVDNVAIVSDIKMERPEKFIERQRGQFANRVNIDHPVEVPNPILLHEPAELDDHVETDNDMDDRSARGREDAISDVPLGETGVVAVLGVGAGGPAGCFGYRDKGGRRRAVGRFGGSKITEGCVERALRWLARHQESDGHWDAKKWEGSMRTDAGITGLALLAFLGAGYTEKEGKWKNNVFRATQWIMTQQQADGAIGRGMEGTEPNGVGYHHSICGLALAEAYGMGQNSAVRNAAQKAVDYSCGAHQKDGSGWRYQPKTDPDLSVTGWFVMQLKSAKIAGLNVPASGFQGAVSFTDSVSDQYGKCRYKSDWLSPNYTMTSVGMLVRLYTGCGPGDPRVSGGANYLMESLPVWGENGVGVNFYYWYYGTMTVFQVGGEPWKRWNDALRDMLCDNQRVGGPKDGSAEDVDGSWDPVGTWCARGGRVYSTAVGALCLEVYYRYLPLYRQ